MSESVHAPVIVIGSGPAGYTAAIYAARANLKPLLITGMEQGGQLMTTTEVDNWPGAVNGIEGPQLMQNLLEQAERFDTKIVFDVIHTAHLKEKPIRLEGDMGSYTCDACSGWPTSSKPNPVPLPPPRLTLRGFISRASNIRVSWGFPKTVCRLSAFEDARNYRVVRGSLTGKVLT